MKPKNFPGRKQARRKHVYEQLIARWGKDNIPFGAKQEFDSLTSSLSNGTILEVRTKKSKVMDR